MHLTSYENARRFQEIYVATNGDSVAEIGSQVVEGQASLRTLFEGCQYTGFDFCAGKGVDVVLEDPYSIPAEDNSFDRVISSSCFEHSEFFWLSFLEMTRICRDGGLIYIQAPSNGKFHRYPVDCWRFYPDSGMALQKWGEYNGVKITLLESFTTFQKSDCWNDFVAIFAKGDHANTLHKKRILHTLKDFTNGVMNGEKEILQPTESTEDMARRSVATSIANGSMQVHW